jgi:hypothetical protein
MTSETILDRLAALATKAQESERAVIESWTPEGVFEFGQASAAFHEAADPGTVLALIAIVRAAGALSDNRDFGWSEDALHLDALRAALAAWEVRDGI